MKSAYERAMEKLEQESGPSASLNDEQKARIAEINSVYDAKEAETRLGFDEKLAGAASAEEFHALKQELAETLANLEEKRERERNAVWGEAK